MKHSCAPKTYSEIFSDFACRLQFKDLPDGVQRKAKMHILDTLGVGVACAKSDYVTIIREVLSTIGGKPESTIIGQGEKTSAPMAAMANGSIIHGLDFDDTHLHGVLHPSTFILPAALAVAEARGSGGDEVVTAIVAGYEVVTRMGMAASEKFNKRGFHATSIMGGFGAAVTTGKLMNLSRDQMAKAMGLAGSIHGPGLQEFLNDGSWSKRLHPGWAAHSGIMAALLAEKGFVAPHRILEGKYGLYNSYLGPGQFEEELLIGGLNKKWETLNISYKLYPCCHATQIYMDSMRSLKEKIQIDPADITEIYVKISEFDEKIVAGKEPSKVQPLTPYGARFSLPYCLSVAFIKDEIGTDDFSKAAIRDEEVLSLAQKVTWSVDPDIRSPDLCGYVKILTKENKTYENTERHLRGTSENPVDDAVIINKFKLNTRAIFSNGMQEQVIDSTLKLDQAPNVCGLMELLRI